MGEMEKQIYKASDFQYPSEFCQWPTYSSAEQVKLWNLF